MFDFFRASRKRSWGAAVFIGCLFVFLAFILTSKKTDRTRGSVEAALGSVKVLVGEADFRSKGSLTFEKLIAGQPVLSGELIAVHEASQATISFNGGASIRLQPGARMVTERDSSRVANAVLATLLDGDADVLATGSADLFRLVKNGHDVTAKGVGATVPETLIIDSGPRVFSASPPATRDVVVTATTPIETPTPAQQIEAPRMGDENGGSQVSANSLSNEEIRRAMGNETGFYRRCYLTYLNRTAQTAQRESATVTVGFVISSSGKVRDAKVVRSDFEDAVLNNCVLETVERTRFRAFKASDIPVLEFPIELR